MRDYGFIEKTYRLEEKLFEDGQLLLNVILNNTDDNFLTEPTTVELFRDNQWDSKLFTNYLLQQWMAKERISNNKFELESCKVKELEAIYEWAKLNVDSL